MPDAGTVAVTVGLGVLINASYDLQKGKGSPAVTMLAGGAVMGILIVIGSTTNEWELVEAVGVLYLVGSLFAHGTEIAGLNTALTSPSTSSSYSSKAGGSTGGVTSGGGGGGGGGGGV